jgi:hypothetical protein
MVNIEETPEQTQIADYNAYLQLKDLNYSDKDVAKHMSYTMRQMNELKSKFSV